MRKRGNLFEFRKVGFEFKFARCELFFEIFFDLDVYVLGVDLEGVLFVFFFVCLEVSFFYLYIGVGC